jgi:MFS family permease
MNNTLIEFMILLDTSIVNIALPSIQSGLHFSETDIGWVQNIYNLIFGGFLLFGGRVADLFGSRKLYMLGLARFTVVTNANRLRSWHPEERSGRTSTHSS